MVSGDGKDATSGLDAKGEYESVEELEVDRTGLRYASEFLEQPGGIFTHIDLTLPCKLDLLL